MAPSRALLRRVTTACMRLHTTATSRLTYIATATPLQRRTILTPRLALTRCAYLPATSTRSYSQPSNSAPEPPDYLNEAELHIFNKIKGELEPVKLEVQDISGGCGSMYAIEIESTKFEGLTMIKQHKLVNQVLKEEIAQWHGVQLRTKAA